MAGCATKRIRGVKLGWVTTRCGSASQARAPSSPQSRSWPVIVCEPRPTLPHLPSPPSRTSHRSLSPAVCIPGLLSSSFTVPSCIPLPFEALSPRPPAESPRRWPSPANPSIIIYYLPITTPIPRTSKHRNQHPPTSVQNLHRGAIVEAIVRRPSIRHRTPPHRTTTGSPFPLSAIVRHSRHRRPACYC